jgi:hypothetical protein
MAVGRRDSATRAVGDTATTASQAATIIVTRAVVVGERGHGSLIEPTQPPSPSEVHALGGLTEDGVRRARTRSSELKVNGGFPGSKKSPP